ncbi:hypothetical protein L210DRAFT_2970400 [Boletus edulis BED1]|uniref:Ribonuclease H1 N-terminal domain-containing protein n=1 Tax=Boletus edulis BED1 TaxID=1328754 RepID=A0AAD4C2J7_BOLED|nr:hypothetical protein L210DRAFT_2970400 [Boletus edulis BED1]
MNNSRRYYAVRIGRQGPRLYDNYPEFAAATLGLSGSSGKGFDNIYDAQEWLTGYLIPMASIQTNINVNLNVSDGRNISAATPMSTSTFSVPQQAFSNDSVPGLDRVQGLPREPAEVKDDPSIPVGEPAVELSDEQNNILQMVKSGRNIFFTGAAGDTMFENRMRISAFTTIIYRYRKVRATPSHHPLSTFGIWF